MAPISKQWSAGKPAPGWREVLRDEFKKDYMKDLIRFLDEDAKQFPIFPEPKNIFRAFSLTDFPEVKVVILGQDPYHGPGQAHGLAFSVEQGVDFPPSLRNVYKEIKEDIGTDPPPSGNLDRWAKQGVFLLNTVLTVRRGQANSHRAKGWELFTEKAIKALSDRKEPLVFLLWGRPAQAHEKHIDGNRHLILKAPHPSPLSAHGGFFGCRHFSKTNQFLKSNGSRPIDW